MSHSYGRIVGWLVAIVVLVALVSNWPMIQRLVASRTGTPRLFLASAGATNNAPVATAQTATTTYGIARTITLAGTDADGDNLTYSVVTSPSHGSLSGTSPNLTYTPTTGYSGSDSFTFKVSDGTDTSEAAKVSVVIKPYGTSRIIDGLLVENLFGSHVSTTDYMGTYPTKGQSFVDPTTGLTVTRVSDIMDSPRLNGSTGEYACPKWSTTPCLNEPDFGFVNGYATYTNINVTGQYGIALGSDAGLFHLYNLSTGAYLWVLQTEKKNMRWDLSGRSGTETTMYYNDSQAIYKVNVLTPSSPVKVYDLSTDYPSTYGIQSEDHLDQSTNAHYRSIGVNFNPSSDSNPDEVAVIDLTTGQRLPGVIDVPSNGAGHEMSPSGDWLFVSMDPGMRFYRISDLAKGITDNYVSFDTVTTYNHYSWAYDKAGNEVLVFLENGNDRMESFAPATGEMTYIAYFTDFGVGWCLNYHIARIQNVNKKGWFLMSTYGYPNGSACGNTTIGWAGNSLFLVEIAPRYENPLIIRVAPTYDLRNSYNASTGAYVDNGYFTESFANIDLAGNNIYWGTNWYATKNLELFKVTLPSDWQNITSAAGGTTYTPRVNPPTLQINPPTFSSLFKIFSQTVPNSLANVWSSLFNLNSK